MKTKKVRGHKRIWRDIDFWVETQKNLDIKLLKEHQRDHVKIEISPWNRISVTNSQFSEPKKETKKRILQGLIEIYESWKVSLDKLKEPYYLKIWLFGPRFSNSQVVCAIGKSLDFYKDTFNKPNYDKEFNPRNYKYLEKELSEFKWDYFLDEDHIDVSETEFDALIKGDVWLGEK